MTPQDKGGFELDAGTVENFLALLKDHEQHRVAREDPTLTRTAVFVAPITLTKVGETGLPEVSRRVHASFAGGPDLMILTRRTSDGFELPEPASDREERAVRQDEVLATTKAQIAEGIERLGLSVPLLNGWLRFPLPPPA